MQWLAILALSIFTAVAYGIVHDQITARICVEYFTIGHPMIIPTDDPTVLGIVWGILATWWVGALIGVPLAIMARSGSGPKLSAGQLIRPLALLCAGCGAFAIVAGLLGYVAASQGWVWLVGPMARAVPPDKHTAFLVDLWAHSASYLGGFLGGLLLLNWTRRQRFRTRSLGE